MLVACIRPVCALLAPCRAGASTPIVTALFRSGSLAACVSEQVVLPALEDVFGWQSSAIRTLFKAYGLPLHEWERIRTDLLTFGQEHGSTSLSLH